MNARQTAPKVLAPWDGRDLQALLTLDRAGTDTYRNRFGDANLNGRSYGGQLLGQAMMAACRTAPAGRAPSMMQLTFLQGAIHDAPIHFAVARLQDGKRFSSRHVTATQAGGGAHGPRRILDAQVTFAVALDAPAHQAATRAEADPRGLPGLAAMPREWEEKLGLIGGYSLREKPCMDFRVPDMDRQVAPGAGNSAFRFWLKALDPLPADPHLHAAAFAYLSDWWLNFSALNAHTGGLLPGKGVYTSSLNHGLWLHRSPRADAWMHFDCHSPAAADGRGLVIARVHDEAGMLIASATQECLMGYTDSGPRVAA